MSHTTTNDSEDGMLSKDQEDSPIDEGSCGMGGGTVLKKGPWTSTEDAILVDYVKKHGEGNWNAVQKHSGLSRCGKSCRLRWANHLRPNLKKGSFTSEEEKLIIELHAKMGNKWARMATHLPGRTDNEIKNYWNTRIKRRQRAGLPLYPPEVSSQTFNEDLQTQTIDEFSGVAAPHCSLLQGNNYEIPDGMMDHLKSNQGVLSYAAGMPDISVGSMLTHGLGSSQYCSFTRPLIHRPKRIRESETLFPGFGGNTGLPLFDQFQGSACGKISRPELSFSYDPDPGIRGPLGFGFMPGSHANLNGTFSTSKPYSGIMKSELPSLQYPETDLGSWGMSSPQPPSLEPVDAYIRSPSPTGTVHSDCLSPRNSGLLDALVREAQTLTGTRNHSPDKSSNSGAVTPSDAVDSSMLNLYEPEWEEYGCSATSVFSECTPISGSSLDDCPPAKTLPATTVKTEPVDHISNEDGSQQEKPQISLSRPDALFDAGWFEQSSECSKEQSAVTDPIAAFLGDDCYGAYKVSGGTSMGSQGWGIGSCPWNNMPAVCQMSELP
ncbi:hypothetical protein Scep_013794 [Stephania cephalantha]|uniref:Transcription factor n=1 Tax=Stephania cephalantha TaxID=152367 RepID=A0AAP0J042_9MAGN